MLQIRLCFLKNRVNNITRSQDNNKTRARTHTHAHAQRYTHLRVRVSALTQHLKNTEAYGVELCELYQNCTQLCALDMGRYSYNKPGDDIYLNLVFSHLWRWLFEKLDISYHFVLKDIYMLSLSVSLDNITSYDLMSVFQSINKNYVQAYTYT